MTGVRDAALVLVGTHVLAFGGGYVAHRRPIDTEVKHRGMFRIDTTRVLATTVESLREENKLLVYSYKGTAKVEANRTFLWVLHGHQELIVPAVVPFYVDLADLRIADVTFDEQKRRVRVRLPRLILGDVAFDVEHATTINGGVLTFSDSQVEALRKLAYRYARKAMVAQAQQGGFRKAAERNAIDDMQQQFARPLLAAGLRDVTFDISFK